MAMVINSNIQSLNAQRHLNTSLMDQNKASERLSSGLRINTAADDAAGLAIANRMTSQVKGLNQAIRNANDGVSLIQTAEGGLAETTNILQRMRELSIQSANGIYDQGNRDTLNAEVQQLKLEIDRIAETTGFNGLNILDGSLGKVDLQIGENANQTVALEIGKVDTGSLGTGDSGDVVGRALTAGIAAQLVQVTGGSGSLVINNQSVGSLTGTTTAKEAIDLINAGLDGVEVSVFTEFKADATTGATGKLTGTETATITTVLIDGSSNVIDIRQTQNMDEVVAQINEKGSGVVTASLDDDGKLLLSAVDAVSIATGGANIANIGFTATTQNASLKFDAEAGTDNINITVGTGAAVGDLGIDTRENGDITGIAATGAAGAGELLENELVLNGVNIGAASASSAATLIADSISNVIAINKKSDESGVVASADSAGIISLNSVSGNEISIDFGTGTAATTPTTAEQNIMNKIGLNVANHTRGAGSAVANIDISTAKGAQAAIDITTAALDEINTVRGDLGAVSNRLGHTVSNLSNVSENAAAARSQIMDADFAVESANLSRAQVLQQAGNAMLAQANARPQQVLSLLQ